MTITYTLRCSEDGMSLGNNNCQTKIDYGLPSCSPRQHWRLEGLVASEVKPPRRPRLAAAGELLQRTH
jgi:hypothetical protein